MSKLPQIIKIIRAGSVEGLSTMSVLTENFGYLLFCVYNYRNKYPFSSWGEVLFLYLQDVMVVFLLAFYRGLSLFETVVFVSLSLGLLLALPDGIVPLTLLALIQSMQVATVSKLPQILNNIKNGSTGQLSGITLFCNFSGTGARVFTTLQEAPDPILLFSWGLAFFFNTLLFIQFIFSSGSKKTLKQCKKSINQSVFCKTGQSEIKPDWE